MAEILKTKAIRDDIAELAKTSAAGAPLSIVADYCDESAYLIVENTDGAATAVCTIAAGDYQRAVIGELKCDIAPGKTCVIGPLDSMRFKKQDGTIGVAVTGVGDLTKVKLALIHY